MNLQLFKSKLIRDISNIPGWSSNRKIVVFESDDWGSIRMSSINAFEKLLKAGVDERFNHYNKYDSLESNSDLEMLFETLVKHRDKNGLCPVFTGVNIVANPDFDKIKASDFSEYYYEPFTDTLKRYPEHDNVYKLLLEGVEKRIFVPSFHGREHLNVKLWLLALQNGHKTTHVAFENSITGVCNGIAGELIPNFQAAFYINKIEDNEQLKSILNTGLDLFENIYGYKSEYFVPTNGPFNNSLEKVLAQNGIKYINTAKIQKEPLGSGRNKKNIRFIGKQNSLQQLYLTRNCFFEPSSMEHPANTDWVDNCLHEIESAFRWGKPATISSHRVNYIGFLHSENRSRGLMQLNELLSKMLKRWPDIEFMTSVELGDLIMNSKR